jgi:ComF family protein
MTVPLISAARLALKTIGDALLTVGIAAPCAACGRILDSPTSGPVCESCWASIPTLTPPLCDLCGDGLPSWRFTSVPLGRCARCRRGNRSIDCAGAIGPYDGTLRSIVQAFKYDGRRSLARPLASLMRQRGAHLLVGTDAVVPVPLHRSRRRERGFNQAADLARFLGLPVVKALRRTRGTAVQASLPSARRHANVRNAFTLTRAGRALDRATVVLVDDVATTGATLDACARALKRGGIREVRCLTAARAVTPRR